MSEHRDGEEGTGNADKEEDDRTIITTGDR
jgi:hypothetical protein